MGKPIIDMDDLKAAMTPDNERYHYSEYYWKEIFISEIKGRALLDEAMKKNPNLNTIFTEEQYKQMCLDEDVARKLLGLD